MFREAVFLFFPASADAQTTPVSARAAPPKMTAPLPHRKNIRITLANRIFPYFGTLIAKYFNAPKEGGRIDTTGE
ncbi:hypothetical protein DENIS_4593 [Desulfonema ishimotonii]|uniref:Uncharacterized protein n=1 Tax=Desulfonema ishimotonii TaxID=45657 RepID=A0A401G399_9BACT|nr:hypothetical protein DENIS_4593 [Desulfonema ishimotonii]